MATRQVFSWGNDLVTVSVEYDETVNPLRVTGVRVVNNGSELVYAALVRGSDKRLYAETFPAGESYIPIPTRVADRIGFTVVRGGMWNGVSYQVRYPA